MRYRVAGYHTSVTTRATKTKAGGCDSKCNKLPWATPYTRNLGTVGLGYMDYRAEGYPSENSDLYSNYRMECIRDRVLYPRLGRNSNLILFFFGFRFLQLQTLDLYELINFSIFKILPLFDVCAFVRFHRHGYPKDFKEPPLYYSDFVFRYRFSLYHGIYMEV